MDTIADCSKEVKLIKFNSLEAEKNQSFCAVEIQNGDYEYDCDNNVTNRQSNCCKSDLDASEANLTNQKDELPGVQIAPKWPWSHVTSFNKNLQHYLQESSPAMSHKSQQSNYMEPFQLIWRQLSYEIDQRNYDQLISRALDRLRCFWSSKESTNSKDNLNQIDLNSFDMLPVKNKRLIFDNMNGYIRSGEITAILGPSGAGKTSLLNAICGKIKNYRGQIQLIGGGNRRMRLSIIPQKDYLMENLTVRENLIYSSRLLNLDKDFDHEANIFRVVKMLNLVHCFDSRASKISGGEYKRVSIAQELLKQPDILILDEPTSGLDSLTCKNLVKSLGQLIEASRRGTINPIAIVLTIHQPDVDVYQMFDHIYCMARGGKVIIDGHPSETMATIREHLDKKLSNDIVVPDSLGVNPANILIEIASGDIYGQEVIDRMAQIQLKQFEHYLSSNADMSHESCDRRHQSINHHKTTLNLLSAINLLEVTKNEVDNNNEDIMISSTIKPAQQTEMKQEASTPSISSILFNSQNNGAKLNRLIRDKRLNAKNDHSGQFWKHTNLLARRAFKSTIRDPLMSVIGLLFHLCVPFVMWTVYSQNIGTAKACPMIQPEVDVVSLISNDTIDLIQNQQEELSRSLECSTMFFLATYAFSMCSVSVAALAFPLNMHVLLKEVRNGWYNMPSYVLAKTIANFPFEVIFPVLSVVVIYQILGMPSSHMEWRLWAIALVMALISMISHTQGYIFGALFMDDVQTAIFLASSSTLPLTLLSGFTARIQQMPTILQKLSLISLYRYSSDSINIIRFGYGICPCYESTNDYLQTHQPAFSDIPSNMRSIFTYYLTTNTANDNNTAVVIGDNNSTSILDNATSGINTNLVPGISYDLTLNSTARNELLNKLESNEVDLFGKLADLMTRSFTYGRGINSCSSVRSQLLVTAGTPEDEVLPLLFGGMLGLLIIGKIIMFLIVKFRISRRL